MHNHELNELMILIGQYAGLHLPSIYTNDEEGFKKRENKRLEIIQLIDTIDKKWKEKQDLCITAAAVLCAKNHLERENEE